MFVGDRNVGATVGHLFNTRTKATGAPITLAGSPTLAVYKDGGTTESAAGATLVVNFDGVTGLHRAQVDTSADGAFYTAGSRFQVVLVGGTVDGESVGGAVVLEFTLGLLAVIAGYVDTVEASLTTIAGYTDTVEAGQTSLASTLTTIAGYTDTVETVLGQIKAKTDALPTDPADASDVAALVTAVDDLVDTEVAAIKAVTDALGPLISGGAFTVPALANAPTGGSVTFPSWFDNVAANGRIQVDLWSAMGDQLFPDDGGILAVTASTVTLEWKDRTATGAELEVLTNGLTQTAVLGPITTSTANTSVTYEVVGGWLHGTPQVGDRYSIGRRALPEWNQYYRELMNRIGPEGVSLNTLLAVLVAMAAGKISGAKLTGSGNASVKALNSNTERLSIAYDAEHNRLTVTITPPAAVA
jgi:hypothetical protein